MKTFYSLIVIYFSCFNLSAQVLDISFGAEGKLITPISQWGGASSVALQSDGKIVAVGSSSDNPAQTSDFTLVRYNPDGNLDSSFGSNGYATTAISKGNGADIAYSV